MISKQNRSTNIWCKDACSKNNLEQGSCTINEIDAYRQSHNTKYESHSTILKCQNFLLQHVLQQSHIKETRSLSASRSIGVTLMFLVHLWLSSAVAAKHGNTPTAEKCSTDVLEKEWDKMIVVARPSLLNNFKGSNTWANYVLNHHAEYNSQRHTIRNPPFTPCTPSHVHKFNMETSNIFLGLFRVADFI